MPLMSTQSPNPSAPAPGELPARKRQLDLPLDPAGGGQPRLAEHLDRVLLPGAEVDPQRQGIVAHREAEERLEDAPEVEHRRAGRAHPRDERRAEHLGAPRVPRRHADRAALGEGADRAADPHGKLGGQLHADLAAHPLVVEGAGRAPLCREMVGDGRAVRDLHAARDPDARADLRARADGGAFADRRALPEPGARLDRRAGAEDRAFGGGVLAEHAAGQQHAPRTCAPAPTVQPSSSTLPSPTCALPPIRTPSPTHTGGVSS